MVLQRGLLDKNNKLCMNCNHPEISHKKIVRNGKEYRYYCDKSLGNHNFCKCKKFISKKDLFNSKEIFKKIIINVENPYPKDIFKWNNKEELDFNRGRFNKHCFEIWENFRTKLLEEIEG